MCVIVEENTMGRGQGDLFNYSAEPGHRSKVYKKGFGLTVTGFFEREDKALSSTENKGMGRRSRQTSFTLCTEEGALGLKKHYTGKEGSGESNHFGRTPRG